ncbi:MAG: c-type cytochrome [Planctomycetes bacterium]|nr:c-type cytochrome [Planctomycetota bacterium]
MDVPADSRKPLIPAWAGLALVALGAILCAVAAVLFSSKPGSGARLWGDELKELPNTPQAIAEMGAALVAAKNCNYCHRTDATQPVDHPRINCQHCHQGKNVSDHLAPPLNRIAERRPPDWLRRFLRYPYAIRNHSAFRMPDLNLTDFEVDVAARYLEQLSGASYQRTETAPRELDEFEKTYARTDNPDAAKLNRGRELYVRHNCRSCHDIAGEKTTAVADASGHLPQSALFAPDLTNVWQRVRPRWLAVAIRKPGEHMPWSGMTEPAGMTDTEAGDIAYYLINGAPSPKPTVNYAQVQEIFNNRCVSCHYGPHADATPAMNPEGGSGYLAVWNRYPRQLSLESYGNAMRGSHDDLARIEQGKEVIGRNRAVIVPYAANSPMLYHLRALKQPAMPFGHDPLPEAEISLIERWILEGAREK